MLRSRRQTVLLKASRDGKLTWRSKVSTMQLDPFFYSSSPWVPHAVRESVLPTSCWSALTLNLHRIDGAR
jgi:hypothetical protein